MAKGGSFDILSNVLAVGGGGGGSGKSFVAYALACGLALNGKKVLLLDADPSGNRLHDMFSMTPPELTLDDFMEGRARNINDAISPTSNENLALLCGASALIGLSQPASSEGRMLAGGLGSVGADYLVADVGDGEGTRELDFFNSAAIRIIVANPTAESISATYGFLQKAVIRRLATVFAYDPLIVEGIKALLKGELGRKGRILEMIEDLDVIREGATDRVLEALSSLRYFVFLNMATEEKGGKIAAEMSRSAGEALGIELRYAGSLGFDKQVEESMGSGASVLLNPVTGAGLGSEAEAQVRKIAVSIFDEDRKAPSPERLQLKVVARGAHEMQGGFNEDVNFDGRIYHVQTEDLGSRKMQVITLVYFDGHILFSKPSTYRELGCEDKPDKAVTDAVQKQHRTVAGGIRSGKLLERLNASGAGL